MESSFESLKLPPQSFEAEQAVLGALMLDDQEDSLCLPAVEKLTPESFYSPPHRVIFKAMMQMVALNKPLDAITVSDYLKDSGELESVGGLAYIGEMANNILSISNVGAHAELINRKHMLRSLVSGATEVINSALNPDGKTPEEIVDRAQQVFLSISESGVKGPGPEYISSILARSISQIEERCKNPGGVFGIPTGFQEIDSLTNGLHKGELVIIAARPAMGKTSFAMNIAEYAAMKSKKAVLVFSMEMSSDDLMKRMISSVGRVDQSKLKAGTLKDPDWVMVSKALKALKDAKLFIDDSPALSPMDIRSRARRIAKENELGLIVVDYLQLMHVPGRSENRTAEISIISRALKALAKELNIPIIAMAQLNRTLEGRVNKRPIMSDIRESGAIEQDADLIMMLYRDEVYNPDSPDKGTAEVIITKHRNGPIGMIRLTFVGHHTRFDNCMTTQGLVSIE